MAVGDPRISVPQVVGSATRRVVTLETMDCQVATPGESLSDKDSANPKRSPDSGEKPKVAHGIFASS